MLSSIENYTKTDIAEIKSCNDTPVVDYSEEAEEMAEGLWHKDEHSNLYGAANYYNISSTHFAVIKKAAPWADEINGYSLPGSKVYQDPAYDNLIKSVKLKAKNKMEKIAGTKVIRNGEFQNAEMQNLYCATGYLLKYEYWKTSSYPSSKRLQLLTLGYLSHLIGDTYAHRTIVPFNIQFISGSIRDNKNFLSQDFNPGALPELKNKIKGGTFEYRSLKTYATNASVLNREYIDKKEFHGNRYTNSQHCVAKELKWVFQDNKSSYTYQLFLQKPGYEEDSKLSSFKRFAGGCGGNISDFSAENWKKYSTDN